MLSKGRIVWGGPVLDVLKIYLSEMNVKQLPIEKLLYLINPVFIIIVSLQIPYGTSLSFPFPNPNSILKT